MEIENPAVGFSPIFLVLKKGICDAFFDAFATRPPFPWELHMTRQTLPTLLTLTLKPHSRQTQLYHHLVAVGSVDLTTDTFRTTLRSVDCLIGFWKEHPVDRDEFLRTCIDGWNKCQLPHPLITWPIYQWIHGDAYRRTQIDSDGRVYFKYHTSIFTYQLINQ